MMCLLVLLAIIFTFYHGSCHSLRLNAEHSRYAAARRSLPSLRKLSNTSPTSLKSQAEFVSSLTIAVGDYAGEIEKATGTEIYGPIMRAGVFIFVSGFVSAFIAAFIVSKSDSWEGLAEEFDRGKESQLVDLPTLSTSNEPSTVPNAKVPSVSPESVISSEVRDLDL